MKYKLPLLTGAFLSGSIWLASAGPLQRIGHTTLTPRHSAPDDKGMYAALIDPAGGYAYFFGNYLFKLDITGDLPVAVGSSIQSGQYSEGAIDPTGGYAYMPKGRVSATINRFFLGAGAGSVSNAGSFTLTETSTFAMSIVVDDSDPIVTNHCAYVMCSGTPAKVVKVALSPFKELSSVTLNNGENSFQWGQIDTKNGYAYFATSTVFTSPMVPQVLKIKLTPGTNAPIRVGVVNIGVTPVPLWTSSFDKVHGYLYYATDNGTTNVPETIYKVAAGLGDALPVAVPFDGVKLHTNEVQIISQFVDPQNGFVYFADDNTYPGRVYQFSMNGTNAPFELGYLQLQGGTNDVTPPDGTSGANTTTNNNGLLPYGEVYLRSAVFDPVRHFAYLGQDSRPNQVVKIQPAQIDPFQFTPTLAPAGGALQFNFTNILGATFSILSSTNPAAPLTNWSVLGGVTEISSGHFQFTAPVTSNSPDNFFCVRSP